MSKTSTFEVPFKRRRTEKTNYRKRIALLKSKKQRVVVRKTNKNTIIQVVDFVNEGDKTMCSANSSELKKIGWKHSTSNLSAAYLAGFLCGTRAKHLKLEQAILDIGLHSPIHGSKIFACLKGFVDAGVKVTADQTVFPKEERIKGKHLKTPLDQKEFDKVVKLIEEKKGVLNG